MNDKLKNEKLKEALDHMEYSVNYGLFKYGKEWRFFDEDLEKLKWALEYLNDYVNKQCYYINDDYMLIHNSEE